MDHRCGTRRSVDFRVHLTGLPGAIGVGRMRDVSATGAFIETLLQLPLLAPVDIELIAACESQFESLRISGFVVRHAISGFALEWWEFNPSINADLASLADVRAKTAARLPR